MDISSASSFVSTGSARGDAALLGVINSNELAKEQGAQVVDLIQQAGSVGRTDPAGVSVSPSGRVDGFA